MEIYPITTKTPVPASEVPNPKAGHFSMFYDASNGNALSIKDSNGVVTEVGSSGGGGGGSTFLKATSTIDQSTWDSNTTYTKVVGGVTGAVVGDHVLITVSAAFADHLITNNIPKEFFGYVTGANTVVVSGRVGGWVDISALGAVSWQITVFK